MGAGFLERYLVEHGKFCTDAHQGSNAADTDAAVEAEQMAYGELSTGTEPSLLEGFMNSLVTMSNFVGKTLTLPRELGFSGIDRRSHGKTREDRKRDHEHPLQGGGWSHGHDAVLRVICRNRGPGTP